jgi:lysophospholipase L1-like esterase
MILFVGCSYTWGSGLQYEYLYDKGWSVDEINKVLPVNYHLEHLSYEADQYRKQNNWPNLVAKEMNKAFVIGTYTNGGSNLTTTLHSIEHCHQISRTNSITTVVVQFSDWLRDVNDDTISRYPGNLLNVTTQEFIDNTILNQIEQVVNVCNSLRGAYDHNLKDHKYPKNPYPAWVGLSWQKDVGDVLKKHYPENFIPIYRDGKEYNSFAPNIDEGLRICDVLPGVDDTHLSSKGCKVIADSIIRKLKSYE